MSDCFRAEADSHSWALGQVSPLNFLLAILTIVRASRLRMITAARARNSATSEHVQNQLTVLKQVVQWHQEEQPDSGDIPATSLKDHATGSSGGN